MADNKTPPNPAPKGDVSNVGAATPATPPDTKGPGYWRAKLRPTEIRLSTDRAHQAHFDAYFAGAAFAGKWEDEWPLITQEEFVQKLNEVANLEIGGHWPDGVHFSADNRGSNARPTAPKKAEG